MGKFMLKDYNYTQALVKFKEAFGYLKEAVGGK